MIKNALLGIFLSLFLACKTAPKGPTCISDVPAGGMQCHDSMTGESYFISYDQTDKYVSFPPDYFKELLQYCQEKNELPTD